MTCETCRRLLTDATGWYKVRRGGRYHWFCLECSGQARPRAYPSIVVLYGGLPWW